MDYAPYYASIIKPSFAPPPWAFGLAWGVIYPLIAVALVWLFVLVRRGQVGHGLFWLFVLNMAANFAFTPLQLKVGSTLLATLDIYLILITLAVFQFKLFRRSKVIFFFLLPYLLWGAFATVLQTTILFLN